MAFSFVGSFFRAIVGRSKISAIEVSQKAARKLAREVGFDQNLFRGPDAFRSFEEP